MARKLLLALCVTACVALPAAATAAAPPGVAAFPPDTAASVNSTPHGVWSTPALAGAHGSQAISPFTDAHGCPSTYTCGWIDSGFSNLMGKWAGNNTNFQVFPRSGCQTGTWNDCVSSIDNNGTSGCSVTYFWNAGYGTPSFNDAQHIAYGSLGSSNDQFSSDRWC